MLFRRYGSFAGGIDLPDEKRSTLNQAIRPWRRPERLLVPLAPCGAHAATPLVQAGQLVTAGQKIASAPDSAGVDVYCPLAGRVAGLKAAEVAGADCFLPSPAIELTDISGQLELPPVSPVFDWRHCQGSELRERIAQGALTTCRRPAEPLSQWLEAAGASRCRTLVVNAMGNQPYVTADHRLLVDCGAEVVRGLAILARALDVDQAVLAVDRRRTDDYRQLVGPARTYRIALVALPHKYPTGADAMLLKVLLRREVPCGGTAMDVGAAVTGPATCLAVYRWTACGMPPTGRAVTVAGERIDQPANFWLPYGTECAALAGQADRTIVHGGPMTGLRCGRQCVVGPSTDAVLALEAPPAARPGPCIRCGWCTDHCPARLNVAAMNDCFELGLIDRAARTGVLACVECGVCSYVCPARLPLSQRVRQLKHLARSCAGAQADAT